jgi:hypothetical protein
VLPERCAQHNVLLLRPSGSGNDTLCGCFPPRVSPDDSNQNECRFAPNRRASFTRGVSIQVITLIFGERAWVGRVMAGLAILGYAAYRLAWHQSGSLTAVAAALALGVIALGMFGARHKEPIHIDGKKSL